MLNDKEKNTDENIEENIVEENIVEENVTDNSQDTQVLKQKKKGKIAGLFLSRAFKRGSLATVITALFIVAILIINVISSLLVKNFDFLNFDFSTNSINQLSDDTLNLLDSLEDDINITILAKEDQYKSAGDVYTQAYTVIKQYDQKSDKINIDWVDIYANPSFVNKYPDDQLVPTDYIVTKGDDYRILTTDMLFNLVYDEATGEQTVESINVEPTVTTAIMNVISGEQTKISFVEGLGDYDANAFKSILKQNNYEIVESKIATEEFDKDSNVLVLFAPTVDLSAEGAEKISDFLNNDGEYGRSLIYIPTTPTDVDTPILDSLLEEWNIKLKKGFVADEDAKYKVTNDGVSILDYDNKDFTAGLKSESIPLVQVYGVPVEILDENSVKPLFSTSENAMYIPFDADENFKPEDAETGKYTIGAISTKVDGKTGENKSSVITINTPYMFSEQFLSATTFNNAEYFVNLINIQSEKEDTGVIIAPKNTVDRAIGIMMEEAESISIIFTTVLPILILLIGLVVWLRRRKK